MVLGSAVFGLLAGSLIINFVPVLIDRGVPASRAAKVSAIMGITIIAGRISIGRLLDRIRPSYVGTGVFAIAALAAASFVMGEVDTAAVAVAAVGLATRAELEIFSFIALHYFGTKAYGQIFGLLYCAYTATSVIGPIVGARLLMSSGYQALFLTAAVGFAVAADLFLTLNYAR